MQYISFTIILFLLTPSQRSKPLQDSTISNLISEFRRKLKVVGNGYILDGILESNDIHRWRFKSSEKETSRRIEIRVFGPTKGGVNVPDER